VIEQTVAAIETTTKKYSVISGSKRREEGGEKGLITFAAGK